MKKIEIILDFGSFICEAELFDTSVAEKLTEHLPCTIDPQKWGNEIYGSIGIDCGESDPITEIPPGGIAYTNQGNYLCVFFGQRPAWPVEYIGRIKGDDWKQLIDNRKFVTVIVSLKK
jgi:hypothetical protein